MTAPETARRLEWLMQVLAPADVARSEAEPTIDCEPIDENIPVAVDENVPVPVEDNVPVPVEDNVPGRLNEALRYALGRIESDPVLVDDIMSCLGWGGGEPAGAYALEGSPGISREGLSPMVDRALNRLRDDGFVPAAVRQSVDVVEQSLPLLEAELCEALLNAKLCYVRFSCEAMISIAAAFDGAPPFELVRFGPRAGLVKLGTANEINRLVAAAEQLVLRRGCANLGDLTDRAREIFGQATSRAFTEAAIRTAPGFEWLDQEGGWFWYMPGRLRGSNSLVSLIKRVLAVAPQISLRDLRATMRRDYRFGSFAPPLTVLASLCRRLYFVRLHKDMASRLAAVLPWESVLSGEEAAVIDIFRGATTPLMSRAELLSRCRNCGIDEDRIGRLLLRSVILQMPVPGSYALVGAEMAPDDLAPSGAAVAADAGHEVLAEGRIMLFWRLDSAALLNGVLRVPETLRESLEGDYRFENTAGDELGFLQLRQLACWDVRAFLRFARAEIGDALLIVFDPRAGRATGLIADGTAMLRASAGDYASLIAACEEDRKSGRDFAADGPLAASP